MAITKKTDKDSKSFWQSVESARAKVESWPAWKRDLKVTQFSVNDGSRSSDPAIVNSNSGCEKEG